MQDCVEVDSVTICPIAFSEKRGADSELDGSLKSARIQKVASDTASNGIRSPSFNNSYETLKSPNLVQVDPVWVPSAEIRTITVRFQQTSFAKEAHAINQR